jgi:hypothetical protein
VVSKLQEWVSVKDFGAVGDGVADDTAAIQAAVSSGAKTVLFPAGRYLLTGAINATGAIALFGVGMASTILEWTTGNGFVFTGVAADNAPVTITGMTLLKQPNPANGAAITVNNTAQISAGNIQNRTSPRLVVRDVAVKGSGTVFDSGWLSGIVCQSVLHALIDSYHFEGKTDATQSIIDTASAINFSGAGSSVELVVRNSWIFYAQSAITAADCEGLFVSGCNLIGVDVGVDFGATAPEPQLNLIDNHINANAACVLGVNLVQSTIAQNLLYARNSAPANVVGVQLRDCETVNVDGNIFVDTSNFNFDGVVFLTGVTSSNVRNNTFQLTTTSVWFQSGSSGNTANGNTFNSVSTKYLDSGTNNVITLASLSGEGYDTSEQDILTQWGTSVATLDASGNGTVTFPKAFRATFYTATVSSGDPTVTGGDAAFSVRQASCNTTTLAFSVRPNPGAVPVRVNWVAYGN